MKKSASISPQSHHVQPQTVAAQPLPPPRLLRSRSGAPSSSSMLPSDTLKFSSRVSPSGRFSMPDRSKSTSRARPSGRDQQNDDNGITNNSSDKNSGVVTLTTRNSRSAPPSPSAWALSYGHSISTELPNFNLPPPAAKSEDQRASGKNSAVSKVLKYFKQKKVSPMAEEKFHRLRILHNRLVQWKFMNARAQAAVDSIQRKAQERLLGVWLEIAIVRGSVAEKYIQVNRLRHEIKVWTMMTSQIGMLHEWARLERKHGEGVDRLIWKLSSLSLLLPLEDALGDIGPVSEAMAMAMDAMDNISSTTRSCFLEAEKLRQMAAELVHTHKRQKRYLEELAKMASPILNLEAGEASLRAHTIQALQETTGRAKAKLKLKLKLKG